MLDKSSSEGEILDVYLGIENDAEKIVDMLTDVIIRRLAADYGATVDDEGRKAIRTHGREWIGTCVSTIVHALATGETPE